MVAAWPLCVVLFVRWISTTSAEQGFPSSAGGEMPFVQSFQEPKYKIELHPVDSPHPTAPDQEVVPMTDRDGRRYMCALSDPHVTQNAKKDEGQQNGSSIGLVTDARSTRKTPDELLLALKDKCSRRLEGWWRYELCYKEDIRQFHVDTTGKKDVVTQEFTLGKYDEEATAALHRDKNDAFLQKDPRSQSAAQRYHAHLYTNGTRCDLTNEPRQTEVRFVCSTEPGKAFINSIKEAPSCKYTVIFHVPMLCDHPLFHEEQPPWVMIHCNEVAYADNVPEEEVETLPSDLLSLTEDAEIKEVVETS
ncbi:protein OS-9 [Marchantia polymorpha subsp. ruderalis]